MREGAGPAGSIPSPALYTEIGFLGVFRPPGPLRPRQRGLQQPRPSSGRPRPAAILPVLWALGGGYLFPPRPLPELVWAGFWHFSCLPGFLGRRNAPTRTPTEEAGKWPPHRAAAGVTAGHHPGAGGGGSLHPAVPPSRRPSQRGGCCRRRWHRDVAPAVRRWPWHTGQVLVSPKKFFVLRVRRPSPPPVPSRPSVSPGAGAEHGPRRPRALFHLLVPLAFPAARRSETFVTGLPKHFPERQGPASPQNSRRADESFHAGKGSDRVFPGLFFFFFFFHLEATWQRRGSVRNPHSSHVGKPLAAPSRWDPGMESAHPSRSGTSRLLWDGDTARGDAAVPGTRRPRSGRGGAGPSGPSPCTDSWPPPAPLPRG